MSSSWAVSADQMNHLEQMLFAAGMPEASLVEKAGLMSAARITVLFPAATHPRVGVFVGPGHNGADALVVARELLLAGRTVKVWSLAEETSKPLTYDLLRYVTLLGAHRCAFPEEALEDCDLVIDGLFGCGLKRPLEGLAALAIHALNAESKPVVALDLPSGMHADRGWLPGSVCTQASLTLCAGLWKYGLLEDSSKAHTGVVECLDIGIPPWVLDNLHTQTSVQTSVQAQPARIVATCSDFLPFTLPPPRAHASHKYTAGHCYLRVGSEQFPGAALLSALGARASGAGFLTVSVPGQVRLALTLALPDAVSLDCCGTRAPRSASEFARFDALLCGPGLNSQEFEKDDLQACLSLANGPVVLDAGALTLLAAHPEFLKACKAPVILTPHWGEFFRLCPDLQTAVQGQGGTSIGMNKVEAARTAAKRLGAFIVLKGPHTVIAAPDGRAAINLHATPALARAGTGDVFAGLLVGLLAQAPKDVFEAACAAVWWHSQTARALEATHGQAAVNAHALALALAGA